MPMWASYIVKAYAWTLLLAKDGVAQWFLQHMGLEPVLASILSIPGVGGNTLSTSGLGRFLVFVYIWLPFMILPIQAALRALATFVAACFCGSGGSPIADVPLCDPATGGTGYRSRFHLYFFADAGRLYRAAAGGAAGYFIGSMVYAQQGAIGNMPMAAAFTLVPIVLIAIYLSIVKRLGAFDAL